MEIFEKIRRLRTERKLKQGEVAAVLDLKQSAYNKIESGKTELRWSIIVKLAAFYMLHPIELIAYGEKIEEMEFITTIIKEREQIAASVILNMNDRNKQTMTLNDMNRQQMAIIEQHNAKKRENDRIAGVDHSKSIEKLEQLIKELTKKKHKTPVYKKRPKLKSKK
jgi:transcriptional regulator with XRE-family HTH domain